MSTAFIPYGEIEKMAMALGKGKMFGKTPEELLPLMLIANAEGKHPAIVAHEYDMIQGRPALNSRAALSRFQAAGGFIEWIVRNDKKAAAKFRHPQGGELSVEWTIERAAAAGLTGKGTWKQYPAQMLSSRVVAEGVRAVFPGCLSGFYTSEEVQDFDPPKGQASPEPAPRAKAEPKPADAQQTVTIEDDPDNTDERLNWPAAKILKLFAEFANPHDERGNPLDDWVFDEAYLADLRAAVRGKTPAELVALYESTKAESKRRRIAMLDAIPAKSPEAERAEAEAAELFETQGVPA